MLENSLNLRTKDRDQEYGSLLSSKDSASTQRRSESCHSIVKINDAQDGPHGVEKKIGFDNFLVCLLHC